MIDNGNLVRAGIIVVLGAVLVVGKVDTTKIAEADAPVNVTYLTRLEKGVLLDNPKELAQDFTVFGRNIKKTHFLSLDKKIKKEVIPNINLLNTQLTELKAVEKGLEHAINSIPTSDYEHSKMELSSFIVEELKDRELIYEIEYNYDLYSEVPDEVEPEEGTPPTDTLLEGSVVDPVEDTAINTGYQDAFKITIYRINEDDNYEKLDEVLNQIFIQEPYEISRLKLGYNELSKSYFLTFVIQV